MERPSLPRNPYGHLTALRDPSHFFGRADVLQRLYASIIDRQCVSLIGQRRMGKSSILACLGVPEMQRRFGVEHELRAHLLVFLDLGRYIDKTRDDFLRAACTQLLRQGRERFGLTQPQDAGLDAFSDLLDQIDERGSHPVLLLDAFDTITRNTHFDADFLAYLRSLANDRKVSFVTASLASLDKYCHQDIVGSPFFNIFHSLYLKPLTEEESLRLILTPARDAGYSFTESEVKKVLELAGRHPFFLQRVCYFLFEEKYLRGAERSEGGGERETIKFTSVKQNAYADLHPHFEHMWRNCLDEEQREVLKGEARRMSSGQRHIPELSESALFRKFVREIYGVGPIAITPEYLETVLEKLNDTKFLGESDLAALNLVYAQSTQPRSVTEKGSIVRKILHEAYGRLRPDTPFEDEANEWRVYNLLNYSYFKPSARMNNTQIATRLHISSRTFYREREEAVKELLGVLYDMEMASREDSDL